MCKLQYVPFLCWKGNYGYNVYYYFLGNKQWVNWLGKNHIFGRQLKIRVVFKFWKIGGFWFVADEEILVTCCGKNIWRLQSFGFIRLWGSDKILKLYYGYYYFLIFFSGTKNESLRCEKHIFTDNWELCLCSKFENLWVFGLLLEEENLVAYLRKGMWRLQGFDFKDCG